MCVPVVKDNAHVVIAMFEIKYGVLSHQYKQFKAYQDKILLVLEKMQWLYKYYFLISTALVAKIRTTADASQT